MNTRSIFRSPRHGRAGLLSSVRPQLCAHAAVPRCCPSRRSICRPASQSRRNPQGVIAGGCFWCTEAVYKQLEGRRESRQRLRRRLKKTANYEAVCSGDTGHAESIQITYDPTKISYGQLLRVFFAVIDPTTKNSQGNDHGTQYRSAIFYENDEQKKVAESYIKQLTDAKAFVSRS